MNHAISRRRFLGQLNCAALGSSAMLGTMLNLRLANSLAADEPCNDCKVLVCLFLSGGCDSFNLLVPWESARYTSYAQSRGVAGSEGGLALDRNTLLRLPSPASDFGLHPALSRIHQMAGGTGAFSGRRRLAFLANIGTLVQPITKSQFNAWEQGNNAALPVPKALFSHSDQIEQWQTAVPQGLSQLSGWAGRAADILHSLNSPEAGSMSLSLSGSNVFQVGNQSQQFVITEGGAIAFDSGPPGSPALLRNAALRNILDQQYTHLLTEGFSQVTRQSLDAQAHFQRVFDSPTADLGSEADRLFPSDNYLARTLRAVVRTIKARSQLGLKRLTFFVDYGGWDHHGELLNTQADMLSTLDTAVGAYQQALELLGLAPSVVTFTASDFGRTLRSNGRGTDHAWGGNAMVFGGPVLGGKLLGQYPDLTLDGPEDVGHGGRILPSTAVDLYFAELLKWFGIPPQSLPYVLPNIANFYNPASGTMPLGFLG
jgi:uncharacterized protein (DUF1501 family)